MGNESPMKISKFVRDYACEEPIVLFYGLAGCKKTTLAMVISEIYEGRYLTPAQYGIAHLEDGTPLAYQRLRRYAKFFKELELSIQKGGTVVVDACFDMPSVKKRLLRIARLYDSRKWIFVRCFTSDRELTVQRLIRRGQENPPFDNHACTGASLRITEEGLTDDFLNFCLDKNKSGEGYLHGIFDSASPLFKWDGPLENMVTAKIAIYFLILYAETSYSWREKNE